MADQDVAPEWVVDLAREILEHIYAHTSRQLFTHEEWQQIIRKHAAAFEARDSRLRRDIKELEDSRQEARNEVAQYAAEKGRLREERDEARANRDYVLRARDQAREERAAERARAEAAESRLRQAEELAEHRRQRIVLLTENLEFESSLKKELLPYQERAVKAEERAATLERELGADAMTCAECGHEDFEHDKKGRCHNGWWIDERQREDACMCGREGDEPRR